MPRFRIKAWCDDWSHEEVIEAASKAEAQETAHDVCQTLIANHVDAGSEAEQVPADTPLGVADEEE